MLDLERWLSSWECTLLSWKTHVWFLTPSVRWLTTAVTLALEGSVASSGLLEHWMRSHTRVHTPTSLKINLQKKNFLKLELFYIKIRDYSSKCLEVELISKRDLSVVNKPEQGLTHTRLSLNTWWLNEHKQRWHLWKGKPSSQVLILCKIRCLLNPVSIAHQLFIKCWATQNKLTAIDVVWR